MLTKISLRICHIVIFAGSKVTHPLQITAAQEWIRGVFPSQSDAEQRLLENCQKLGLTFHGHTPADGNCFFHAVSDQLSLLGLPRQSAAQLRHNVVVYLMCHPKIKVCVQDITSSKSEPSLYVHDQHLST